MDRKDAIAWVLSVCVGYLRLSQAKTLSELVAAALGTAQLSLAGLGRQLRRDTSVKHRIKRVWRFLTNRRIEPSDAMRGVVNRLLRRRFKKKAPLVISFDWTKVRRFPTLMAAVVVHGRALPLAWGCYQDQVQGKSQNALEEGLLLLVRSMIPTDVPVILLADRGFGRTELARFCQRYHFQYAIRIKPDAWIRAEGFAGPLAQYPVSKGMCRRLAQVQYRKTRPVVQDLIVRWKEGLPPKKDEPWYLMTNLPGSALRVSELYARRFRIEEFFRDAKASQFGWALEKTRIKKTEHLNRLLLILALAYLLLVGLGLWAKAHCRAGRWASSNRAKECSAFTVGRIVRAEFHVAVATIWATLCASVNWVGANWG